MHSLRGMTRLMEDGGLQARTTRVFGGYLQGADGQELQMDLCAQTSLLEQHPVCTMKLLKLEVTCIDVFYSGQVIRTNLFSLIGWRITKWRRGSLRGCKASYYRCFLDILCHLFDHLRCLYFSSFTSYSKSCTNKYCSCRL